MILLNFSHPMTGEQLAHIERLAGEAPGRVINAPAQFDPALPFREQVINLVEGLGLSPDEWETTPILVNPPSLSFIAAALLAELHGRMGYFAPIVRLRPVAGALPPRYEVAELINLQELRDAARSRRNGRGG